MDPSGGSRVCVCVTGVITPPPPLGMWMTVTRAMSKGGGVLVNVQEWGCLSNFLRADDVMRTMSKGGGSYLSSRPILVVVYRFLGFFYLPTANLPIYHNLPISTDFFADLPNFNFFYRYFHVLMVKSASPYNKYYL